MRPQPVIEALGLPVDGHGRVLTDPYLRVEGYEDVWAGGDCASVQHRDGGTCPPVGLYALKHGRQIGANIAHAVRGEPLEAFNYSAFAAGISIGRRNAVGEVLGVPLRGKLGWILWRAILFYYLPTWDRRLRLLADWLIWPFVGRDIVDMDNTAYSDYEVRHHVFSAGETVAHVERPVRYVHVILDGDVELVRDGEVVGALGPGGHFGRKVLELHPADEARAVTHVRTLALREDQANKLHDLLASAGRLRARTETMPVIDP